MAKIFIGIGILFLIIGLIYLFFPNAFSWFGRMPLILSLYSGIHLEKLMSPLTGTLDLKNNFITNIPIKYLIENFQFTSNARLNNQR